MNISEDQIIRDWTLKDHDKLLVSKFSKKYQSYAAVQICFLRISGRFLTQVSDLSCDVIFYINKQLKLNKSLFPLKPARKATYIEYRKIIFNHLGFTKFGESSKEILHEWLRSINHSALTEEELYTRTCHYLMQEKISLPSAKQLERFIASIRLTEYQVIFDKVNKQIDDELNSEIIKILNHQEGEPYSLFNKLKIYPPTASITSIKNYMTSFKRINEIPFKAVDISFIEETLFQYLFKQAKYYSADAVKRFKSAKRNTLVIIFLTETRKVILDYLAQMHDQYISDICRKCRNIYDSELKQFQNKHDKALGKVNKIVDYILDQDLEGSDSLRLDELFKNTCSKEDLKDSRDNMKDYQIFLRYGYSNLLQNRYQSMRKYFSEYLNLIEFDASNKNSSLIKAINIIKKLDNKEIRSLPKNAPIDFISHDLKKSVFDQNKNLKRNIWEIGVAIAIKEQLTSGKLYIPQSKRYLSFRDSVYNDIQWNHIKDSSYESLGLSKNNNQAIKNLMEDFLTVVKQAQKNYKKDDFAIIKDKKFKLRRKEKIEEHPELKRIQKLISSSLPKIKIEQLLIEVDKMTDFSKHFKPIHGQKNRPDNFYKTLIASILSQATNIGISAMQDATLDITSDMIANVLGSFVHEESIKVANSEIVNQHSNLPITNIYGQGQISSSDGQRFAIKASSLMASFCPRYFGYYEKAIGIYTHVSDKYSVFNTRAISCSPREALYVIDGLLENNTILEIKEHTTDTEGFTEHIFALLHLLGYKFIPRIKNLKNQQLYSIGKDYDYGVFNEILNKKIDFDIISEQWDDVIRTVASLKDKKTPAHEIVRMLSRNNSDPLSKAFTNLGRLLKTQHILMYVTDSDMRDKIYRQLNKGEHRHNLPRYIFFAHQGKFQTGDYEEIMNKASCLSLVSNAALYWNTIHIDKVIQDLKDKGEKIPNEVLPHISLLPYNHIIPIGTYFIDSVKGSDKK